MSSKEKIPITIRKKVWVKYCGRIYDSVCFCCNEEQISRDNFHCGHIISERKGGTAKITNLRPICAQCNSSMGTQNMELFMKKYGLVKKKYWNGVKNCV